MNYSRGSCPPGTIFGGIIQGWNDWDWRNCQRCLHLGLKLSGVELSEVKLSCVVLSELKISDLKLSGVELSFLVQGGTIQGETIKGGTIQGGTIPGGIVKYGSTYLCRTIQVKLSRYTLNRSYVS